MSTTVLMKVLESAPARYDLGIRLLTLGAADRAYDRLAAHVTAGQRALDIGCGTGALTLRVAERGARVKGIDVNAQMLKIAEYRIERAGLGSYVELHEMGVAELDAEPSEHYDAVMSGLCLSELTDDERSFALRGAQRVLRPGGLLLLADEVLPRGMLNRLLHWMIRLPLVIITYAITQTTTRALKRLPEAVREVGFEVESVRWSRLGSFLELVARKPGEGG